MVDQTAERSAGPRDAAGGSPTSSMLGGARYRDTALSAAEQGSTAVEAHNPQRLYRHHVDDARLRHLCGHLHQLGPRSADRPRDRRRVMGGAMIPSDLIERASTVRIEDEIERRGIKLVGRVDRCGPCPQCGGKDRFSINVRKQVFLCRGCAARGNVIALVRFLDGCGFHEAVECLTGERGPAPRPHDGPRRPTPREDEGDKHALMLARQIAFELCPMLESPGETYLRDIRRIETSAIE